MLVFTMQLALTAGRWFNGWKHYSHVCLRSLLFPNCLGCTHITPTSDGLQSIPMTHYTASPCLLPKQLWRSRPCVSFTGQLTLGQYMIPPKKHHVGEHFNYYSSMARRTVGQLWGDQGLCSHVVMSVNIGQWKCLTHICTSCMDHTWMHIHYWTGYWVCTQSFYEAMVKKNTLLKEEEN